MPRVLRFSLLASALLLPLSGCTFLTGTPPDLTGNWQVAGFVASAGAVASPVGAFMGALTNSGTKVSGTFRLLPTSSSPCLSPLTDIPVTGTADGLGTLRLTSTQFANGSVATFSMYINNKNLHSPGGGTYTITGGQCAMPSTTATIVQIAPVTGAYSGTLTASGSSANGAATATLTQGAADGDGQFPISGTISFVSPACTNSLTVTGLASGVTLSAALAQTSPLPPSAGILAGVIVPDSSSLTLSLNLLGACNLGSYSGTLNRR